MRIAPLRVNLLVITPLRCKLIGAHPDWKIAPLRGKSLEAKEVI